MKLRSKGFPCINSDPREKYFQNTASDVLVHITVWYSGIKGVV